METKKKLGNNFGSGNNGNKKKMPKVIPRAAADYVLQLKIIIDGEGEKFPDQKGSLEFFTALPDKIFCLGLLSHSWPSGKFVNACYA